MEEAHRVAARGLGRIALALERRTVSNDMLKEVIARLRRAADILERAARRNPPR